ncbi:MAG: MmgE/PrpD family protein [Anaerolineaceae bacterium]|nr:MAG: MmgE/PrpD family protein [Anaerolineaceae bacterium]
MMNKGTAVQTIAGYVANLKFEDFDELTIIRARQVIYDTLGTMLGGYQTRLGKLAADYAAEMYPGDEATLIADGRRTTTQGAAWANGVMGKYLGMDDTHPTGGHVAAELVPVVLALGEQLKLSGQQMIVALVAGYDVIDVIQPAVRSWQRERGLDQKGQSGTLASAVTAAVAMGLNEDQIAHALALSMDMASGTEQYVYDAGKCDTKDLLAGYAASNGIFAAKLAKFGFQGPPGALDGEYGYFHAFGPGYDPAYLDRLGKGYALAMTGFKPHAGCRHVHACVDATHELLKSGQPDLNAIEFIEVDSYKSAITPDFRVNYEPESVGQAGFSLPVTVSIILTRGRWYREDIEDFDNPEARRLRSLVKVGLDEAIESDYPNRNGCEVRIKTKDGQLYTGRVENAKGDPRNMMTDEEFDQKFRYLVGDLLPEERISALTDAIDQLEELGNVGELVQLTIPSLVSA